MHRNIWRFHLSGLSAASGASINARLTPVPHCKTDGQHGACQVLVSTRSSRRMMTCLMMPCPQSQRDLDPLNYALKPIQLIPDQRLPLLQWTIGKGDR